MLDGDGKSYMDDGLGDWRIAAASRLAKDVPAAYPGGPSHKVGTAVYLSCLVQTEEGENIGFTLPSSTAMALNIAVKAGRAATALKKEIKFKSVVTPNGPGRSVSSQSTPVLYDFFEQCMVAVTFSYQALEVFCNHTIAREQKTGMDIKRGNKRHLLIPREIERQLSTEDKLSQVLPRIKGVPTPKGKKPWEAYRKLKDARDATIHLKSADQRVVDRESLFFVFLSRNPESFASASLEMIKYFTGREDHRWMRLFEI